MNDYLIKYRVGEGSKERSQVIEGAANKSDASFKFQSIAPDNSIVISVDQITEPEEVKQSNLVSRRMIINNKFDQFILDQLQEKDLTNNDLIRYLGMSKGAWVKLRRNPENFYLYDLMLLAEYLKVPLSVLIEKTTQVVHDEKHEDILDPARFRSKSK